MAMQASMQESIVDHINPGHQKTSEEMVKLEKSVQGRLPSQHPDSPTVKKKWLGQMMTEEKLLYPLLEKEMRQQVQDASKEHNEVRPLIDSPHSRERARGRMGPRHLRMIKQGNQHHVQEEESQILPATQRMRGDKRLCELGAEFNRMKEQQM